MSDQNIELQRKQIKRKGLSEYADQYSLFGKEKYPQSKMPKKKRNSNNNQYTSGSATMFKIEKREPSESQNSGVNSQEQEASHCSGQMLYQKEWDVAIPSDPYISYKATVIQNSAFTALDDKLSAFAIQGFDTVLNVLKVSEPHLVYRQRNHFFCSCDDIRRKFLENVLICTVEDADKFHPPCIHLRAVRDIYESFVYSNDIETSDLKTEMIDHEYCPDISHEIKETFFDISELPFMVDVYAVLSSKKYGLVKVSFGTMKCLTCPQKCGHTRHVDHLLQKYEGLECPEILEKINFRLCRFNKTAYELKCLSHKKISFDLPDNLKERIQESLEDVFIVEDGILNAISLSDSCLACGSQFSEEQFSSRRRTASLFLSKYKMKEVQHFSQVCSNDECRNIQHYDGQDDCVLNMERFLVHYEILRDYMYHFLFSRCTLHSYYTAWKQHQMDVGNSEFPSVFPYAYFRWSWYGFLRLLDLDFKESFVCEKSDCGNQPKLLLFDGTTLSFQRIFLSQVQNEDFTSDEIFKGSSHSERVFINNQETRNLLKRFIDSKKTDSPEFDFIHLKTLVTKHQPSLLPLLLHFEEIGCVETCPEEYRQLISVLASNSAVCGAFHYSQLPLLSDLLSQKTVKPDLLHSVQIHIPLLFDLLSKFDFIPKYICSLIDEIITRVKDTFSLPIHITEKSCMDSPLAFFPNLPKVCDRGSYGMDKRKGNPLCTKKSSSHSSLLPGIFTVFCPHGICYGFEVMECAESPNRPFTFLKTRFLSPPDVIIYDNSCNLHNYCLNRDPTFFASTLFAVDSLHWDNHTACSIGYKAHAYPGLRHINTQIVEQNNSRLRKLKSSLSYMSPHNFMDTLKFFLWYCNQEARKRN